MKFCRRVKGPEEKEDFLKISKTIKGFQAWLIGLKRGIYWGLEMARKSRMHVPGGLYHVMLRGNGDGMSFSPMRLISFISATAGRYRD